MDDKIIILLTAAQRKLLMKYQPFFADEELFQLISIAIKKGTRYEIFLSKAQLEDLVDQIAALSNHENNLNKQEDLENLYDELAIYLDEPEEQEMEPDDLDEEFVEDSEDEPDDDDNYHDSRNKQEERISQITGDQQNRTWEDSRASFLSHLQAGLTLPCEVSGIEDFRWEEYYVMGPGNPGQYKRLKQTHPSYTDRYELLEIVPRVNSEWGMFDMDLGARVRRIKDGKEFVLGLAELRALDKKSKNYQLLDDYSVWFINSR